MRKKLDPYQRKHLYLRAGFGPLPDEWAREGNAEELVADLFSESQKYDPLKVVDWVKGKVRQKDLTPEEKKAFRQARRANGKELNKEWLIRMAGNRGRLREKMTLFWHSHFACRVMMPGALQDLNNVCRSYALGSFKDLLLGVSKSPAMLKFLNNQQNRKAHPNENFARELLELFSLGRGNYTEKDIKEAARAFTGWGFNLEGEFVLRKRQHDTGPKTFLGQRGNWDGEDIIRIILEQKQCARFICTKLYRYFVNPLVNQSHVDELTAVLYDSQYNLGKTMAAMLTASWFYDRRNIGVRIKSPIELLVGYMRIFKLDFEDAHYPFLVQKILGQILFRPPNVAGWPGHRSWIDSSTLMARMSLPGFLLYSQDLPLEAKEDLSSVGAGKRKGGGKLGKIKTLPDWSVLDRAFRIGGEGTVKTRLAFFLLQDRDNKAPLDQIQLPAGAAHDQKLELLTLQIMALPDYQLC